MKIKKKSVKEVEELTEHLYNLLTAKRICHSLVPAMRNAEIRRTNTFAITVRNETDEYIILVKVVGQRDDDSAPTRYQGRRGHHER